MNISSYKSIIFDCDGVLLNSNQIKTEAFYQTVLPYGEDLARKFVNYHRENGGISRNKKFQYFIENIASITKHDLEVSNLLSRYGSIVVDGLNKCEICEDLELLRNKDAQVKWFVVSGGNELEIKEVFKKKKMFQYFNGGIFGSPKSKDSIFKNLIDENIIDFPAIYLGDSRYDHEVASKYLIDFLFIHGWTEFDDWQNYCASQSIKSTEKIKNLADFWT